MIELLSGYQKTTQELVFRVYAEAIPETDRAHKNRISHFVAYDLLGAALLKDFGLRSVKITRSGLEKPTLIHDFLHMNLSHCKGLAVCAVGTVPLGIDAEAPRKLRENLLPKLCSEEEIAQIRSAEKPEFMFTRLWTLKEAYGKYTGLGIREKLDQVSFYIGTQPEFRHPAAEKVLFYQMILENQYAVSLCVPAGDYRLEAAQKDWILI